MNGIVVNCESKISLQKFESLFILLKMWVKSIWFVFEFEFEWVTEWVYRAFTQNLVLSQSEEWRIGCSYCLFGGITGTGVIYMVGKWCIFLWLCNSEEEAKKKIYNVSCERYFGFGCEIDEETSNKLDGLCCYAFVCYRVSVMAALILVCYLYPFFVDRSAWCSICPSWFLCWSRE